MVLARVCMQVPARASRIPTNSSHMYITNYHHTHSFRSILHLYDLLPPASPAILGSTTSTHTRLRHLRRKCSRRQLRWLALSLAQMLAHRLTWSKRFVKFECGSPDFEAR